MAIPFTSVARATGGNEIGSPVRPAFGYGDYVVLGESFVGEFAMAVSTAPSPIGHTRKPLLNGVETNHSSAAPQMFSNNRTDSMQVLLAVLALPCVVLFARQTKVTVVTFLVLLQSCGFIFCKRSAVVCSMLLWVTAKSISHQCHVVLAESSAWNWGGVAERTQSQHSALFTLFLVLSGITRFVFRASHRLGQWGIWLRKSLAPNFFRQYGHLESSFLRPAPGARVGLFMLNCVTNKSSAQGVSCL